MKNQFGKNNPNYKNDKTNNNHCINCRKRISYKAKRCNKCVGKIHSQKLKGKLNGFIIIFMD